MVQRLMRGAIPVRYGIAGYLATAYPKMRQTLLRTWASELSPAQLPSIEVFSPFELGELTSNMKPRLGLEVHRATDFGRKDISELAEEVYEVRYNVRATFWLYSRSDDTGETVGNSRSDAVRQRDDNMGILRSCLLDRPAMGTDFLYMKEDSYTEDYYQASPVPNQSQRWAIGGQLNFDVVSDEMLARKALNKPGEENVFTIETEVMPGITDESGSHLGKFS